MRIRVKVARRIQHRQQKQRHERIHWLMSMVAIGWERAPAVRKLLELDHSSSSRPVSLGRTIRARFQAAPARFSSLPLLSGGQTNFGRREKKSQADEKMRAEKMFHFQSTDGRSHSFIFPNVSLLSHCPVRLWNKQRH